MKELIDKAAVVTEIEKLKGKLLRGSCSSQISMETNCKDEAYDKILSFLDTLEVKEVDLEKELENLIEKEKAFVTDNREVKYYNGDSFNHIYELEFIAKYFFELGMCARNPITAADRGIADEIIFALNTLGKEKMISYDKEIEWVMNKVKEGEEV